jgi:hypothetical protein
MLRQMSGSELEGTPRVSCMALTTMFACAGMHHGTASTKQRSTSGQQASCPSLHGLRSIIAQHRRAHQAEDADKESLQGQHVTQLQGESSPPVGKGASEAWHHEPKARRGHSKVEKGADARVCVEALHDGDLHEDICHLQLAVCVGRNLNHLNAHASF